MRPKPGAPVSTPLALGGADGGRAPARLLDGRSRSSGSRSTATSSSRCCTASRRLGPALKASAVIFAIDWVAVSAIVDRRRDARARARDVRSRCARRTARRARPSARCSRDCGRCSRRRGSDDRRRRSASWTTGGSWSRAAGAIAEATRRGGLPRDRGAQRRQRDRRAARLVLPTRSSSRGCTDHAPLDDFRRLTRDLYIAPRRGRASGRARPSASRGRAPGVRLDAAAGDRASARRVAVTRCTATDELGQRSSHRRFGRPSPQRRPLWIADRRRGTGTSTGCQTADDPEPTSRRAAQASARRTSSRRSRARRRRAAAAATSSQIAANEPISCGIARRPRHEPDVEVLAAVAPAADVHVADRRRSRDGALHAHEQRPELDLRARPAARGSRVRARLEDHDRRQPARPSSGRDEPVLVRPERARVALGAAPAADAARAASRAAPPSTGRVRAHAASSAPSNGHVSHSSTGGTRSAPCVRCPERLRRLRHRSLRACTRASSLVPLELLGRGDVAERRVVRARAPPPPSPRTASRAPRRAT